MDNALWFKDAIFYEVPVRSFYDGNNDGHGDFRGQLILAGARGKFLELQRQLIDQPLRPLRARTVELSLELGDPQLLMGDQRQVFRGLGARHRQLGDPGVAFGDNVPHPRARPPAPLSARRCRLAPQQDRRP